MPEIHYDDIQVNKEIETTFDFRYNEDLEKNLINPLPNFTVHFKFKKDIKLKVKIRDKETKNILIYMSHCTCIIIMKSVSIYIVIYFLRSKHNHVLQIKYRDCNI